MRCDARDLVTSRHCAPRAVVSGCKIRGTKEIDAIAPAERNKTWNPSPAAFSALLTWLDEGRDSAGERYLEMRRRLVTYFERKRVCVPDELADETFNRIARRIAEEGQLTGDPPARYCYITAKFVFLEYLRRPRPSRLPNVESAAPAKVQVDDDGREHRLDCLDRCLTELSERDRELILEYYGGEQRVKIEHRHRLADRLGLSANALAIRACRIRARLEACVGSCCGQK